MATFRVLDKDGKTLKEENKSFDHYKRFSQRAAAEQKFLDSLYIQGATEGRINTLHFRFVNGRSQHYWPSKGTAKLTIEIDFPASVGFEAAHEEFIRMADKWVGDKGTRILTSNPICDGDKVKAAEDLCWIPPTPTKKTPK